jgi:hypothetical protein
MKTKMRRQTYRRDKMFLFFFLFDSIFFSLCSVSDFDFQALFVVGLVTGTLTNGKGADQWASHS